MVQTANTIWRDYTTDGVPSSGPHEPDKVEVRSWGAWLESFLSAVGANSGLVFPTKAQLDANLDYDPFTMAWVVNDTIPANNGIYVKNLSAGFGSWIRLDDLPYSFIRLNDAGAGSANAIVATSSIPLPATPSAALLVMNVFEPNNGPVTIAVNGAAAKPLLTNSGTALPAAALSAGMFIALLDTGTSFRLLTDIVTSSIVAQAEAVLAEFNTQYLRAYATAPSTDPSGGALQEGAFYYNTTSKTHFYWDGDSWEAFPFTTVADESITAAKISAADADNIRHKIGVMDARNLAPRFIDTTFGAMRGVGHNTAVGDGISETIYNVTAPVAKGATSVPLDVVQASGRLMVVLGTDGEYYTYSTGGVAGGTRSPMPVDVAVGPNAFNFWGESAHPTKYGYWAQVDYALRQKFGVWREISRRMPLAFGSATVNQIGNDTNPFNIKPGTECTPVANGDGVKWRFRPKEPGTYRFVFMASKFDPTKSDLTFSALQDSNQLAAYTVNTTDMTRHEVVFNTKSAGQIDISLTRADGPTGGLFICSTLTIQKLVDDTLKSVNWGRHVVLGDSWVANALGIGYRITQRLDKATVIQSGVGGNTAAMLVARFDTDVTPNKPDVVWIVVSTNDIAGGIAPDVFERNIQTLIKKCHEIGSIPILFGPYVGSQDPLRMPMSRRYADEVRYIDRDFNITKYSINAHVGAAVIVPVFSVGNRMHNYRVRGHHLTHQLTVRTAGSIPIGTGNLGTIKATLPTGYLPVAEYTVSPGGDNFSQVVFDNSAGAEVYVSGWIGIEDDV